MKNDLEEINKGCKMAVEAINDIKGAISDKELLKIVENEQKLYQELSNEVEQELKNINEDVNELPIKDKIISFTSIKINELINSSDKHIAEMLFKGTFMGIIQGMKIFNSTKNDTVKKLVDKFITISQNSIEKLKPYL